MKLTPYNVSKAINASFGKFDHFRRNRGKFLNQMVTRFYSRTTIRDREDRKAAPINLLHSAVATLVPNLVYNNPRVKVRTQIILYRDYGTLLEMATNHLIRQIKLRDTLRKVIFDSIFMAGFLKTGIASADRYVTSEDQTLEIGQPYAERIDPDDIILDPMAKDWHQQRFTGNRFRANLDDLIATGLYDADGLTKLSNRYDENEIGQAEKLTEAKSQDLSQMTEIGRYVDLCEVYFPRENLIVTLPYKKDLVTDNFLRVVEYEGPDTGPYHMLGYTPVSDNILPVAPAMVWYDLHILGNRIARKLARQAERLKRVLAYEGQAQEDVAEIADADDGETVRVDNLDKIKELTFGGAAPESYEWMEWVKRQFSEMSGNMDMLSGQSTNSPTATQAEMLQANTSVRLGDMQNAVYNFTADVCRDLGYFIHTDPLIELPLARRVNGVDQQVTYSPEMRQGDFFDFTFEVEPYSMARPDPNMALRRKIEFATNVIPAAAQAAMALGPGFKIGAFLKDIAREVQLEDADEWLDDPTIQQWIMFKIQAAQMMGDPGKAGQYAAGPMIDPQMGMGMPPMNPGQPNPSAMGPDGGITPQTEAAMAQQEAAGDLQKGMRPSARAMAMARG